MAKSDLTAICQVCGQPIYDDENRRLIDLLKQCLELRLISDDAMIEEIKTELAAHEQSRRP